MRVVECHTPEDLMSHRSRGQRGLLRWDALQPEIPSSALLGNFLRLFPPPTKEALRPFAGLDAP